jgi:hypothetical protein
VTNKILATAISALVLAGSVSVVSADAQSRPGGRAPATRVAPPAPAPTTPTVAPTTSVAPTVVTTVAPTTTAPLAIPAPVVVAQNAPAALSCSSATVVGFARPRPCPGSVRPGSRQTLTPVVINDPHPGVSQP